MSVMRLCGACWSYTLKAKCPKCNGETRDPRPPKFSPEDRYGRYRRIAKSRSGAAD